MNDQAKNRIIVGTLILVTFLLFFVAGPASGQTAKYGNAYYTPENYPRGVTYRFPNCPMCNYIRSQWRAQGWVSGSGANKVMVSTQPKVEKVSVSESDGKEYRTEKRMVTETRYRTRQVKRCVNGRCYWETIREPYSVTVEKLVRVPIEKPKAEEPETPPELIPTPEAVVSRVVDILALDSSMTLVDAGCGDGRILIEAADRYGCKSIGVEIDPKTADIARERIKKAGSKAVVFSGDALSWDYSGADAVFVYQMPDLTSEIVDRIPEGVRIASYQHPPAGIRSKRFEIPIGGKTHYVYVGTK